MKTNPSFLVNNLKGGTTEIYSIMPKSWWQQSQRYCIIKKTNNPLKKEIQIISEGPTSLWKGAHKWNANQNTMRCQFALTRMTTIKTIGAIKHVEKLEPLCIVGRNVKWCSDYEKEYRDSSKY